MFVKIKALTVEVLSVKYVINSFEVDPETERNILKSIEELLF